MNATKIKAVVMPVYDGAEAPYLRTLASQSDRLTCLIRGWRNPDAPPCGLRGGFWSASSTICPSFFAH